MIGNATFEACPSIETLNLRDNNLDDGSISRGVLSDLSMLRHLYLADNAFKKIPNDLPNSLLSLSLAGEIYRHRVVSRIFKNAAYFVINWLVTNWVTQSLILWLVGNLISSIVDVTLGKLTVLKNLYLHDNKITNVGLSKRAFLRLKSLTEITLTNNLLSDVPRFPHSVEWVST